MTKRAFVGAVALIVGMAALAMGPLSSSGSGQARGQAVAVDPDDIGGVVTGSKGPEPGVWVIAETTELPTKFRKIVVT